MQYLMTARRSIRVREEWEALDCTAIITEGGVKLYDVGEPLPIAGEAIYVRPGELSFHREWVECTDGLKQLKRQFPEAYEWLTNVTPVRPDHRRLMEAA